MIKLTLPAPLAALLREDGSSGTRRAKAITVAADSWPAVVQQLRDRHPRLADRVFTGSGELAAGVALVVNGEIARSNEDRMSVASGDEISFVPQIAGG
jgi:molybdopterin converting factor small subunit